MKTKLEARESERRRKMCRGCGGRWRVEKDLDEGLTCLFLRLLNMV